MWNWKIIIPVIIICYTLIICRTINISMFDETKARDFYHGDAYSDKNAYSTAIYVNDYGFEKSKFLPVWNYYQKSDSSNAAVYTHYPALPDILTAIYGQIFKSNNEVILRIIPILFSIAFIFIIANVLKKFSNDYTNISYALSILLISNYFIFWADNLHKHQYEEIIKWLFVGLIYQYYTSVNKKNITLSMLALLFIIVSNISFEPIVYLAIVTIGFSIIYEKNIISKTTVILGISASIGIFIHFYQNYLYLGNWEAVINDLTDAAKMRTTGSESIHNELGKTLNWLDYLNIPNLVLMRLERVFIIPGIIFVYLLYLILKKNSQVNNTTKHIIITLLIASASWAIIMTQHFTVHCFTIRHWGIIYGIVITLSITEYKLQFKTLKNKKSKWLYLHYIGWIYILIMACSQHLYDYWRYGFNAININ